MPVQIPYVREIEFEYGDCDQVSPLIRRVVANNPSAFTYKGTGTYIIGKGEVAVVDPGPLLNEHVGALMRALEGETVTHILITHTHSDHSPAAAPLKALTGAETYAYGPHGSGQLNTPDDVQVEEDGDTAFVPDFEIRHGDVIEGNGWTVECVYTPGHTSNHMCFALQEEKALFSGDHVMGWSTSIVSPPDGNMEQYMASLRLLLERDDEVYWPTHGPAITDPKPIVRSFIEHREDRERQIMEQLAAGHTRIQDMVPIMYAAVDKRLYPAAARSVFAHMEHLVATGAVVTKGKPTLGGDYWLA
ncbi:MBL fold metallo-hydrolase [Parvibaculum sp.]|jgi:glyoxylase-like metal-dependent hydrolase (beta-lactamase superfamily II)|uniref:MBL fold metallo-hydrolase n=1 Tax=Parvibaculum sp. TaxID=2024848 RepID=UPI000C5A7A3C|nr:MBL fold metallo-hydrolase [Parvibaculum sp.]MAM95433.1 MBL fold metallo-hydrolase [Parvibaculum sp.]HCX66234.1 MBL fold metallo-hydrolase [Rhodobiaceae bacterium]|tara:strand:- start:3371 stop:4279 length:909 start_codon:yes stop_codon:yes gene_type:complete